MKKSKPCHDKVFKLGGINITYPRNVRGGPFISFFIVFYYVLFCSFSFLLVKFAVFSVFCSMGFLFSQFSVLWILFFSIFHSLSFLFFDFLFSKFSMSFLFFDFLFSEFFYLKICCELSCTERLSFNQLKLTLWPADISGKFYLLFFKIVGHKQTWLYIHVALRLIP